MVVVDKGLVSSVLIGAVFVVVGGVLLFLAGSQTIALIVGGLFIVAGIVVVLKASSINITIDKSQGQILFQKNGLVKHEVRTYAIADAVRVELRNQYQTSTTTMQGRTYSQPTIVWQSVLILKDGTELPLENLQAPGQTNVGVAGVGFSVIGGGEAKEVVVGQQIAAFLGVPFQEIGAPGAALGGGVAQGAMPMNINL
ncbi:MAG: hypothetical protein RLZZ26_331 [Candidatus Parcubacteria bacterium]